MVFDWKMSSLITKYLYIYVNPIIDIMFTRGYIFVAISCMVVFFILENNRTVYTVPQCHIMSPKADLCAYCIVTAHDFVYERYFWCFRFTSSEKAFPKQGLCMGIQYPILSLALNVCLQSYSGCVTRALVDFHFLFLLFNIFCII